MLETASVPDELLTAEEVAQMFRVSAWTVRDWGRKGMIGRVEVPGMAQKLISRDSVERMLQGGEPPIHETLDVAEVETGSWIATCRCGRPIMRVHRHEAIEALDQHIRESR